MKNVEHKRAGKVMDAERLKIVTVLSPPVSGGLR